MRTVVIGGTGHIGTYLIPRLVQAGHEVICITRGNRAPYRSDGAWQAVRMVTADRRQEDKDGSFGRRLADLAPDIVVDMVCFTRAGGEELVRALTGRISLLVSIGTIWVHGFGAEQPVTENARRRPEGEYGIAKAALESYLLEQAGMKDFPATVIHPGHITGPGWNPVNPQGNHNPDVFTTLARGEELALPDRGTDMVHHVHADDVAQAVMGAIEHRNRAAGEAFHAVAPEALTLRGFAEAAAGWFGREPRLTYAPFEKWRKTIAAEDAEDTFEHISRSLCCSITKARQLIGYAPRYSALQAAREAVDRLVEDGIIQA